MYSLDMYCAPSFAIRSPSGKSETVTYRSSGGCNVTMGLTGNITEGSNPNKMYSPLLAAKQYMAMHIGYWGYTGAADFYLEGYCPKERNGTFYAAFTRNKARDEDPPNNVTAIFCEPSYYQQEVNATVDRLTQRPLDITILGEKRPLERDLFNATNWEAQMTTGSTGYDIRGDFMPTVSVPDYLEYVAGTNVSIGSGPSGAGLVQPLVGLSLAVNQLPLEDYVDWQVLSKAYANAYRLMFSRAMVDILGNDFQTSQEMTGVQQYTTEAVVLEPVFTYIVEALLGAVSLATIMLLYLSVTRTRNLRTDPSTIASLMSLVADNEPLLVDFENLDCCTVPDVQKALGAKRYRLVDDGQRATIETIDTDADAIYAAQRSTTELQLLGTARDIAEPVRPKEFRMWTAVPFVSLFFALSIALAILFVRARTNGLPLPSTIKLVQNILENYIPTALATLIEPMWVMINRLLCMLQPIEELRKCKAEAKSSIDLDYSSLPPQLTVFKALKSRHFVLAMVCAMALLSNLLAIAFAGIFNQDLVEMQRAATFTPPFEMKFVSINGSIGPKSTQEYGSREPSGAYRGGNSQDQYLIAESNWTRGTPLPAWTNEKMFYLPYRASELVDETNNTQYEAHTLAFGAELDCETLQYGVDYLARTRKERSNIWVDFNTTARQDSRIVGCAANMSAGLHYGPNRPGIPGLINETCVRGPSATEMTFKPEAAANATQNQKDACMTTVVLAWLRAPDGTCSGFPDRNLTSANSLFIRCRPRLVTSQGIVRTNAAGRLQQPVETTTVATVDETSSRGMFSNDPLNLIGQSNQYLFKFLSGGWHNDSHAEDYMNYFAAREINSSRLVNPAASVPTLEDVQIPLGKAYSRLFAIWLGANKEKLLVPRSDQTGPSIRGWIVSTERRLFLSTPMFAISEAILAIYAVVAIIVYLRRPGRYLARMPTSMAAIISLFAASAAVQDMRQTSHLNKKGRAEHLRLLDSRYGYGSYIGGDDGRVHIGIEKTPFVRARSKSTWLDQKIKSFRKGSAV